MKRPDDPTGPAKSPGDFPDKGWVGKYPSVCEFLVSEVYDDGTSRTPSSLAIKAQEGKVLVAMNDHDLRRSLYFSGESVEAALKSLERGLMAPGADWRSWGGPKKKK